VLIESRSQWSYLLAGTVRVERLNTPDLSQSVLGQNGKNMITELVSAWHVGPAEATFEYWESMHHAAKVAACRCASEGKEHGSANLFGKSSPFTPIV